MNREAKQVEPERSEGEKTLDSLVGMILIIPMMLWQAFACSKVWDWHVAKIAEISFPVLTWFGMILVLKLVNASSKKVESKEFITTQMFRFSIFVGVALLVAWIVHLIAH